MGATTSQEDTKPLLEDQDEGSQPIFDELKIVLIGRKNAGKNKVGNAIVGRKVFTFWNTFRRGTMNKTATVSERQIHLCRVPGWTGELSQSDNIIKELTYWVNSTRPHAVLLVINLESPWSNSTIKTLEDNLSSQLWAHTIVLFTNSMRRDLQKYITCQRLQPLIEKCGQNYLECKKDCNQIAEIEEIVVCKKVASCFNFILPQSKEKLLEDWNSIVERIRSKIVFIKESRENLQANFKGPPPSLEKQLHSKNSEIKRLTKIVQDKEREIEKLRLSIEQPLQEEKEKNKRLQEENNTFKEENNTFKEENNTLKKMYSTLKEDHSSLMKDHNTLKEKKKTLENKYEILQEENKKLQNEITELQKKKITTLQKENTKLREEVTKRDTNYSLNTDDQAQQISKYKVVETLNDKQKKHSDTAAMGIQLQDLSLKQPNWETTLLDILQDLSKDDLSKLKYFLQNEKKQKIPKHLVEDKDICALADQILKSWGTKESIFRMQEIIQKIQRNDLIERYEIFFKQH